MTKTFKAGDKVRITFKGGLAYGSIAEVLSGNVDPWGRYTLTSPDHVSLYYAARDLELVEDALPREITFKDIQKGDLIRCTRKYGDEGEVVATVRVFDQHLNYRSEKYWRAEDQTLVIHKSYKMADSVKFELLDRPKPKLPDEEGTLIQITKAHGKSVDNVTAMFIQNSWVSSTEINGCRYHSSYDIQEWLPLTAIVSPPPFE